MFEKVEADADAYSGSDDDSDEVSGQLIVPPQISPAVAKAQREGRTLIAEVASSSVDDEESRKRPCSEQGSSHPQEARAVRRWAEETSEEEGIRERCEGGQMKS